MKTYLLIVLLIPAFCFAQDSNTTIPKPAADDCPSWNKKSKSSSKAEYLYFLRTNKAKDQPTAVNHPATPSQRAYPSKASVRYAPEEDPFLVPRRARRTNQTATAKNTTVKPDQKVRIEKEETEAPKIKEEIILAKEEPAVSAASDKAEEKNAEAKKETAATGANNRNKKEKKVKKRFSRTPASKVKSCKSGNASKCPSF